MGWERRKNGRRYYYRSRWVNGRVVKEYYGRGPLAELAALQAESRVEVRRERPQRQQEARKDFLAAVALTKALHNAARLETTHVATKTAPLPDEVAEQIRVLEDQRQRGDPSADAKLIQLLRQYPQLACEAGDLAAQAIRAWVKHITGADGVFRVAVEERLKSMREGFPVGEDDGVGQLIVERILATWLQLNYIEERLTQVATLTKSDYEFLAKRQQQAQRQHFAALQAWRQWKQSAANRPALTTGPVRQPRRPVGNNAAGKPVILPFTRRAESA